RNQEPERPRAGDLDYIIAMAMRYDPLDRYGSVGQLSDDVRRHLNGFPVIAREGAWTYNASRFIGRHRVGVSVAVVGALALTAFAINMGVQAQRIRRERDTAERERRVAQ